MSKPYLKSPILPRKMDGLLFFSHKYGPNDNPDSTNLTEGWCQAVKHLVNDIWNDYQRTSNKMPVLYRNEDMQVVIYTFDDDDVEHIISNLRKGAVEKFETTWRLYQRLPTVVDAFQEPPSHPHLLVSVGMSPSADLEEDFNKWYTEEHIPLLSRVPGWLYSSRYIIVACSTNESGPLLPDYVAVHGWASRQSFESNLYKEAVSTPWRMRVVNEGVTKYERFDLDFIQVLEW